MRHDKTTPDHLGAVAYPGRHDTRAGNNQSVWIDTRLRWIGRRPARGGTPRGSGYGYQRLHAARRVYGCS